MPPKSSGVAYLCWFFGLHYLYLEQPGTWIVYLLTAGGLGLWALIDLFRIAGMVADHNARNGASYAPAQNYAFQPARAQPAARESNPWEAVMGGAIVAGVILALVLGCHGGENGSLAKALNWLAVKTAPKAPTVAQAATPLPAPARTPAHQYVAPLAAASSPTPAQAWTRLPNGHYVEHDRAVTGMHSIGGGR